MFHVTEKTRRRESCNSFAVERELFCWSSSIAVLACLAILIGDAKSDASTRRLLETVVAEPLKGYDRTPTGLVPVYPDEPSVPVLTSLYGSWEDVDGSTREEPHSGVDGGAVGDLVIAPARGRVVAVWEADWGWGAEGALLIVHAPGDLGLGSGSPFHYSAFYHLRLADLSTLQEGDTIERGQVFARVWYPGGDSRYLPEVHWEVYEVDDPEQIYWVSNDRGYPAWDNETSRLIDPLFLMRPAGARHNDLKVPIPVFDRQARGKSYRGFTYILGPGAKARGAAATGRPRLPTSK